MSEIRQNIITRDWVIMATERAKRPHEFASKQNLVNALPEHKDNCPFCTGNEHMTGSEHLRIPGDSQPDHWQVRVVPNKFPALAPEGERVRRNEGMQVNLSGVGFHDVVIDHPNHNARMPFLPVADIQKILLSYKIRYQQISLDKRIETIVIFKNYGSAAGSSLEHPHSQIAATPVVPYQFRSRIQEVLRYFDEHGDCIFCRTILDEVANQSRIISENASFIAFIPYAALTPFHTWIFPREHSSSFDNISNTELEDLAAVLKDVLARMYYGLGDPHYNYTIRSSPLADRSTKYYHWYLSIIPRISQKAGFELGSGMYINSALPEESAEFLRNIKIKN